MVRGESGRIVIEVDTHLKDELYVELARRGLTLKAWFVSEAERLVANPGQMSLFEDRGIAGSPGTEPIGAFPIATRGLRAGRRAPVESSRSGAR